MTNNTDYWATTAGLALGLPISLGLAATVQLTRWRAAKLAQPIPGAADIDQDALKKSIMDVNPELTSVEASCFDGIYITGDITPEYLDKLESHRHTSSGKSSDDMVRTQLNLNPAVAAE